LHIRLENHELGMFARFTRKMLGWVEMHELGMFARFAREMLGCLKGRWGSRPSWDEEMAGIRHPQNGCLRRNA